MNVKQKIGVTGGLVTLLIGNGCIDEKKEFMQEGCIVGGLHVKSVYHQVPWRKDYLSLAFYNDKGTLVGDTGRPSQDFVSVAPWVQCDDERLLIYSDEKQIMYFKETEK